MIEELAHAIFDILIEACGAAPALRDAFVRWYCSNTPRPFRFGSGQLDRYAPGSEAVKLHGSSREITPERISQRDAANARISALQRRLLHMPPADRLAWVQEQQRRLERN